MSAVNAESPDLVTFVEARLAEDERTTIAFRDGHAGPCINEEGQDPEDYSKWESCSRHIATAEASRYMDTSFGLRDVEAKRAILAEHPRCYCHAACATCKTCGDGSIWPCPTLRAVASVWSKHPDYREEWGLSG